MEVTTEQVSSTDDKPVPNPTGKGGFGDNPENRNPGGWSKEGSISYQYQKLMRMSPTEFAEFKPETVAQEIALKRITIAKKDNGLYDAKEVTDRTEGKAPQFIGLGDEKDFKKIIVEFVGDDADSGDSPTDSDT